MLSHLVNYIDAVVELLFLQESVHVSQKHFKVRLTVAIWNDDSHVISRDTVTWSPQTSGLDVSVFLDDFCPVVRDHAYGNWTTCKVRLY